MMLFCENAISASFITNCVHTDSHLLDLLFQTVLTPVTFKRYGFEHNFSLAFICVYYILLRLDPTEQFSTVAANQK